MERPARIPLFPLDMVLLPRMQLPLHIFEPRYKLMISRCLEEKIEFGMILAANNAVATMGCTAEILRKTKDYPDGRMDIATEGRAVFRLMDLLHEKEYYEGIVRKKNNSSSLSSKAKFCFWGSRGAIPRRTSLLPFPTGWRPWSRWSSKSGNRCCKRIANRIDANNCWNGCKRLCLS